VPTVRTIFRTQAKASADALQVEVIGHQWWWEFRYPQYKVTTANELYLPVGRKVSFTLKSQDVVHSFWIPQFGGKRDVVTNHPNFLWFTPDSVGEQAWNGMCVEFCGASHANMRFKAFTVTPANFESWAAHQADSAAYGRALVAIPAGAPTSTAALGHAIAAESRARGGLPRPPGAPEPTARPVSAGATVQQAGYVTFPREKLPPHVIPGTPVPPGMSFDESLKGDAQAGRDLLSKGGGGCVACHTIVGNPMMMGVVGPNLTHLATRTTIGAGLYPNDTKHLSLWIKNARWMKPGVLMPTLGAFQRDPVTGQTIPKTGLTDQQIADIVAYLQELK
jgi:cytochrome c oxidase subunit II